ncbi:MAG: hypothetical protein EXR77_19425 [Myxococcales bacterium]|nr:hypothetical protein [Myxococcales bacterium]
MLITDLPLPTLVIGATLGTLSCAWAGMAWAQTLLPIENAAASQSDYTASAEDGASLLLAIAMGFGFTATLAFWLHCLLRPVVVAPMLITLAFAQVIGLAALAKHRKIPPTSVIHPDPRWRSVATSRIGIGALVVGLLWWLRHDGTVPPSSCIGEAAICAIGQGPPGCDVLRTNIGDAQLGNSGVISVVLALCGQAGFRILFAVVGAMLAISGWVLARQAARLFQPNTIRINEFSGWLGAVTMAANPYALSIPLVDENLLTLAFSGATLALTLAERPPWLVVGLLFALVVDMRHPMLVCAPALLLFAWSSPISPKRW